MGSLQEQTSHLNERKGICICRNLFVIGVKPEVAKEKLWKFLIEAKPFMSYGQNDGLGYVALGRGGLWGERWLNPDDAFFNESRVVEPRKKHGKVKYNNFGEIDSEGTTSVLLHTRYATCEKSMANVHPFVIGDTALTHNGMISNQKALKNLVSTCDSECILNEYIEAGVNTDPDKIQKVVDVLRGSFACGVMSKDGEGKYYVDVFRNTSSNLCARYVDELGAIVICTTDGVIEETCKKLGWTCGATFKFKEEQLVRFDAMTGELIFNKEFKPWYSSGNGHTHGHNGYNGYKGNSHYSDWEKEKEEKEKKRVEETVLKVVQGLEQAAAQQEAIEMTRSASNKWTNSSRSTGKQDDSTDPYYYKGEGYPDYKGID